MTQRHREAVGIGRTGVVATRLGLGTAPLGGMFRSVAEADAVDLVVTARAEGIAYFDTAPLYGNGVAERRLGAGLAAAGARSWIVSTKVGRILVAGAEPDSDIYVDEAPEQPVFDYSAAGIQASYEASLTRLGLERADIVFIHDAERHVEQALRETYPALERMRAQGLVGAIGVAMDSPEVPARFVRETDIDVVLIAGRYTLLDQSAAGELFPAAMERGVSVINAGVFNSGVLADPRPGTTFEYAPALPEFIARAQSIRAVAADFGVPLIALALQFPLRHPAVSVVLAGARHRDELLANIAAFDSDIPSACWTALEQAGLLPMSPDPTDRRT